MTPDDGKPQANAAAAPAGSSPWAPFRSPDFRSMASAQFVSNVGGWMQTVGAQELMLTLTTSATLVALIQTAAGLPVMLLAVPAGALGDIVNRRGLLIVSQAFMLVAATALAVLALAGLVTPWVLLGLIFAVGVGQTFTSPTWQTLQPELVPKEERSQAVALGAVNMNLSRAIGPAIGGALYAATSAAALFFVNAASFLPVIGAVGRWHGPGRRSGAAAPEQVWPAIRAGARYIAGSPVLRRILVRAGAFMFAANSIWALLPLVAHSSLHLGSGGYGLLLGGVGVGALAGAASIPKLRATLSANAILTISTLLLAAVIAALAFAKVVALAAALVIVAGVAWILALSILNSQYQASLAPWVKARGMSYYLVIFQGGGAIGSAVFGLLAQHTTLGTALIAAAVLLALSAGLGLREPFIAISPDELLPVGDWPLPDLPAGEVPEGLVLVTVDYHAQPDLEQKMLAAIRDSRHARRRTGAIRWQVWSDTSEPRHISEQFVVGSWEEHARQHERVSRRDEQRFEEIRAMNDPTQPVTVTHWVAASAAADGRPETHRRGARRASQPR